MGGDGRSASAVDPVKVALAFFAGRRTPARRAHPRFRFRIVCNGAALCGSARRVDFVTIVSAPP
jgi:hypothetical protein